MVTEVIWTKTAAHKFDEMTNYLVEQDAQMAAANLAKRLWNRIEQLKKYPGIGRLSQKAKTLRYIRFARFKYVYYRIDGPKCTSAIFSRLAKILTKDRNN